jgi:hypothetical protein
VNRALKMIRPTVSNHRPLMSREMSIAGRLAKNGSRMRKPRRKEGLAPGSGLVDRALVGLGRCRHG